jgi:hypothetical protein
MSISYRLRGIIVSLAWLALTLPARATCVAPPFNSSQSLCNGCRYEGGMRMLRDEVCERGYTPPMNGPAIEIIGNRVVQRAKHGVAGVSGTVIAYAPAKGYAGKDEFTVEVAFRQNRETGKFTVHWDVTVQ